VQCPFHLPSHHEFYLSTISQKIYPHFFYDILTYSPTWETHLQHVKIALEVLRHHQFFIIAKKYAFGQHELEYLGHIVTSQGVKVDMGKIEAMHGLVLLTSLNYVGF
jgi:hypothetical protein